MRKFILGAVALIVAISAAMSAACGDDDNGDEEQAVRATLESAAAAFNNKDVDRFLSHVTDMMITNALGFSSREEARQGLAEFIGDPPITFTSFANYEFEGDAATVEVGEIEGIVRGQTRFELVKVDGAWRINSETDLPVEPPSGAAVVAIDMTEYAFSLDRTSAPGNVAFRVTNSGDEGHEFVLFRITADGDPDAILEQLRSGSEDESTFESMEFVAFDGPYEPGEEDVVVFTEDLQAGSYALVCFVPAEGAGAPHAALGMAELMTIE
ncbi:MAG TPA: hypothetical protein VNM91_12615 [Dehalococcoidia bacterium]|nr:hypothetical protein [Dehalococcoidia bacterium]